MVFLFILDARTEKKSVKFECIKKFAKTSTKNYPRNSGSFYTIFMWQILPRKK